MTDNPPEFPRSDGPLTLITLGAAALVRPGVERPILGPGKPLALLIYLTFLPSKSATREHLLGLLWSDAELDRARHALRQTLWQIRGLLGEDTLGGRDEISLVRGFASDRDEFLAAVAEGRLDEALKAYPGPFLPGFASPGGAAFEHWADLERDQLRGTFVRASETHVRRLIVAGQAREAITSARRVIDLGAQEELGRRLAIEAHLAAADTISACTEADALERWATEEHEPLEPATRDAIRRARNDAAAPSIPGAPPSPTAQLIGELVGRENEFAQILNAWAAVRTGGHRHLHLLAPAGLGKTRLLRDLEARLTAIRAPVRYIRANPGDRAISSALIGDVARALSDQPGAMGISPHTAATLVALEPSLSGRYAVAADTSTGPEALRRRMLAISELAAAVASESPFALLVDDLHWADADSHAVLESVAARLVGTASLLVTASRPVADRHFRSDQRTVLRLKPLEMHEIEAFLVSLGRIETEGYAAGLPRQLLTATGGSPLLVIEMLQLAMERGAVTLADGSWLIHDDAAMAALLQEGEGIRQRIARLSIDSQRLLAALAVAGAPIPVEVLSAAAGIDGDTTVSHLAVLERTGFATQLSAGWQPSHDEIAEQAVPAGTTMRDDIERALGHALLANAGNNQTTRLRAAQHLAKVRDIEGLATLSREELRSRQHQGERNDISAVLAHLVPEDHELRQQVRRALPLATRLRHRANAPAALVGVVALLLFAAVMVMAATHREATLDSRLVVMTRADSAGGEYIQAALRRTDWQSGDTLIASPFTQLQRNVARLNAVGGNVLVWADGDSALMTHEYSDSGGQDLVLAGAAVAVRQTSAPHDDVAPAFSPDRKQVVFESARWSPDSVQNNHVAILLLGTTTPRQVTSGRDFDGRPSWSPDGTRIAYVRRGFEPADTLPHLCTVTVQGVAPECVDIHGVEPIDVIGWLDWHRVLVVAQGDKTKLITEIDLGDSTSKVIESRPVLLASLSPNHRWLACWCESGPTLGPGLQVRPYDAPDAWRPVAISSSSMRGWPSWVDSHPDSTWLASIEIQKPGEIAEGTTHYLHYHATDPRGRDAKFDTLTVRWWSSDTGIAAMDASSGKLHARRSGQTWIHVTAGGWRGDSVRILVGGRPATPAAWLRESWRDMHQWRPVGIPAPVIATGPPFGHAFLNNGDGNYSSGAFTAMEFDARAGVALDVELSTPINRTNWQTVGIALVTFMDTVALAAAAGRDEDPVPSQREGIRRCAVAYPGAEGAGGYRYVSVDAAGRAVMLRRPQSLQSGQPWHLRLQLFADGTCGVAVGGVALYRSPNAMPLDLPVRVWLYGNSVGTKMLVGRLTVWRGDPDDVDWEAVSKEPMKLRRQSQP